MLKRKKIVLWFIYHFRPKKLKQMYYDRDMNHYRIAREVFGLPEPKYKFEWDISNIKKKWWKK